MFVLVSAGLKFFVSSNSVVLTEGDNFGRIHPKFFDRVIQLRREIFLNLASFEKLAWKSIFSASFLHLLVGQY